MPLVRDGVAWDGSVYPYVAGDALEIDPSLRLHAAATPAERLDPVTFEVVRYALWNINVEAGLTIGRISGSPIASIAHDLNPGILTEDGEWVFFGPFLQFQCAAADSGVRWTLEFRSRNPGIHEGDMFLCNDPWIGALHQMDTLIMCPVFVEGALFCWVVSGLHEYDVGGTTPGSFCPDAPDVFHEGQPIPPIKLIDRGELRQDVEDMYLRGSRMPSLLRLDLRAKIAGCDVSRRRVLELVHRYGAEDVKGTMRKVIDDAEAAFCDRLSSLPDGEWTERGYLEAAMPDDHGIYPLYLTARKQGTDLYFSNAGTAAQAGNLNGSYIGYKGGVLTSVCNLLLFDQLYAIGAAMRRCHFALEPGTLTCPLHPAAVSNGAAHAVTMGVAQATNVISKMFVGSSELRREAMAAGGNATWSVVSLSGLDQRGAPYGTVMLGGLAGSIGGFSDHDGIHSGGQTFDPQCKAPNVENDEMFFPVLFLYSRERADSGGAGEYPGGAGIEQALIPHDTDRVVVTTSGSGLYAPPSRGLFGGFPGAGARYRRVRDAGVLAALAARSIPQSLEHTNGPIEELPPKVTGFDLAPDDVLEVAFSVAGGWGDPLRRDPAAVAADCANGHVTRELAAMRYGIHLDAQGNVDREATEAERKRLLAERRVGGGDVRRVPREGVGLRFHESLEQRCGRNACRECDADLGPAEENYKLAAVTRELTPVEAGIPGPEASLWLERAVLLREYACPGCGVLLDVEIGLDGDEPLFDVKVGPAYSPSALREGDYVVFSRR